MKLSWSGSDVLRLTNRRREKLLKRPYWIIFRLLVRFLDQTMIAGHLTNSELLKRELIEFGFKKPIEIQLTPLKHTEKYKKIPHEEFNVLYYMPHKSDLKWRDWLYGIDLITKLEGQYSSPVQFISVSGKDDMRHLYPRIDMYLRPNRHDGNSRMVRECIIQGIPYYWSDENPSYDEMKKQLDHEITKKEINNKV